MRAEKPKCVQDEHGENIIPREPLEQPVGHSRDQISFMQNRDNPSQNPHVPVAGVLAVLVRPARDPFPFSLLKHATDECADASERDNGVDILDLERRVA